MKAMPFFALFCLALSLLAVSSAGNAKDLSSARPLDEYSEHLDYIAETAYQLEPIQVGIGSSEVESYAVQSIDCPQVGVHRPCYRVRFEVRRDGALCQTQLIVHEQAMADMRHPRLTYLAFGVNMSKLGRRSVKLQCPVGATSAPACPSPRDAQVAKACAKIANSSNCTKELTTAREILSANEQSMQQIAGKLFNDPVQENIGKNFAFFADLTGSPFLTNSQFSPPSESERQALIQGIECELSK